MARSITVEVPHTLSAADARRRAERGIADLAGRLPGGGEVSSVWETDGELALHITAIGRPVTARVHFLEHVVRIEIVLPLMLAVMGGTIGTKVRDAVARMLATAPKSAP